MKRLVLPASFLLFSLAVFGSCTLFVTESSFGESWTGKPIDRLQGSWGEPASIVQLPSGQREFKYSVLHGCTYYFAVDANGTIVAYHYEHTHWRACVPLG